MKSHLECGFFLLERVVTIKAIGVPLLVSSTGFIYWDNHELARDRNLEVSAYVLFMLILSFQICD